jgi:hypothetical protein
VRLIGHEIKCSRTDWKRELDDPSKAGAFLPYVAEWWIVVSDRKFVHDGELPEGWGLLAPAGEGLRAVVKAARKPQVELPVGMMAAMLRSVQGATKAELAEARTAKPHTIDRMPRADIYDWVPPSAAGPSEIQRPRHDLRRTHRAAGAA